MRQVFGWSFLGWLTIPLQLYAQMALSPGDRIQVREPEARVWTGELVDISRTELVLRGLRDSRVSVPLRADLLVERNEVGAVSKYMSPLAVVALSTGAFAVAGGVMSVTSAAIWTGSDRFQGTRSEAFLWGAVGGAIFGLAGGLLVAVDEPWVRWVAVPPPGSDGGTMALSPGDWVRVREPDARVWIGELVDMSGTELVLMEDGSASLVSVPLREDLLVARSVEQGLMRDVLTPILGFGILYGATGGFISVLSASFDSDRFRGSGLEAFLWGAAGGAIVGAGSGAIVWMLSGGLGERWVALPPPGSITLGPTGSGSLGLSVALPLGGR